MSLGSERFTNDSFCSRRTSQSLIKPTSLCIFERKKKDLAFPKLILPQVSFLGSLLWDLGCSFCSPCFGTGNWLIR